MEHCSIFYGTNTCSSHNLFRILNLCFSCIFCSDNTVYLYEKPRNFSVALVFSTWLMAYFQFPTFRECDQRWVKPQKGRVVSDLPFCNLPELKQSS